VVVGLVASGVGLAGGIGLSYGLKALLGAVGLEIPSGPVVVSSGTVTTAFVVGMLVSVLSAMVPALRASRVKPVAALRDVAIDRSGASLGRVVAGLTVTGAGVVAFAGGATADGNGAAGLIGLGSLLTILGVFVLGPVLAAPAIKVLGAPLRRFGGVTGRYAQENARRNPKRTAATASALMIGVALVGFITILASTSKGSIESAVDRSFRADYVIDSGSWFAGFAPSIEDDLRDSGLVGSLSGLRVAPVERDGHATELVGIDTASFADLYDLEVSEGALADVHGDGIAITRDAADTDGYALGDTVTLRFADGDDVDLTVRAIYDADLPNSSDAGWIVGLDTYEANVTDQFDRSVFVSVADGVGAEESRAAIDEALAAWPNAEIQDQAEFKESVTGDITMLLNLIYGLLALAVVIALIGIANTLALSIHERTRELGVLRAVGMQRRQVRSAVRWESLLIGLLGAVLGGVLAVGGAFGVVKALDSEGVTELVVPGAQLVTILVLAGFAGVVAATGPARRAGRLDVLQAIASD
jgi:putative ABC transport system permease protein